MPGPRAVDEKNVVQKLATLAAVGVSAALLAAGAAGSGSASPPTPPNWAKPQIKTVVAHGLMGASSVRTFKPNADLTVQTLTDLANGLAQELAPSTPSAMPVRDTTGTTTNTPTDTTPTGTTTAGSSAGAKMSNLDRKLVASLGLLPQAKQFRTAAIAAGLKVPKRFGTEVVARLLALRINHPASEDYLELRPQDTATRAEAARW